MLQHLQDPVRRVHPAEQAPQEVLRHRHCVDTFIIGSDMAQGMSSHAGSCDQGTCLAGVSCCC